MNHNLEWRPPNIFDGGHKYQDVPALNDIIIIEEGYRGVNYFSAYQLVEACGELIENHIFSHKNKDVVVGKAFNTLEDVCYQYMDKLDKLSFFEKIKRWFIILRKKHDKV